MKKKNGWVTFGLLLLAAALLLAGCARDDASVTISTQDREYTANLASKVQLIVPPESLPKGTTVSIKEIDQLIEHEFLGFVPVGLYEISASGEAGFGSAVALQFEYSQVELDSSLAVSDQLAVAYFDETFERWREVDFVVDETNSKVIVKTDHLSLWSLFIKESKYITSTGPHFTIYFNKNANAPLIGTALSGDPIYEYATIVRTGLFDAQKAYTDMGLRLPDHTKVYIDKWDSDHEAQWGWFSKNIEIPLTYIYQNELQMAATHELFHAVQNQYVNFVSMHRDRWWMEATADYAAAYIATSYGLQEPLKLNYLDTGINSGETFHTYQTAYFVKHLVEAGLDFKEMFESVMDPEQRALDALQAYCGKQNTSLRTFYNDFAYSVLFEDQINTEKLTTDVYTELVTQKLEFDLDKDSELAELVTVRSDYASKLAGVKFISSQKNDFNISVQALEPTPGVMVHYIIASGPNRVDVVSRDGLDHIPVELAVKNGDIVYFLVTNYAPQNGSVTVVVNKESQPQPYSHTRTTKVYNNYFSVDVAFNLLANQSFTLSQEIIHGDVLALMLDFPKSNKDIIIDLETLVSNLAFTPEYGAGPNHEALFKDMYWSTAEGEIQGSQYRLVIPAGDTQMRSLGYDIVIDILNKEENSLHWGGGASVIGLKIRIIE